MKNKILRKDVSSNTMLPKIELIRIVKNKSGEIFVDQSQKANGRGVYLKANLEALEIAKKQRLLEKGLKSKIEADVFSMIEKEIKENWK